MKNEKGGHMKELDFDELHEAVNKLMVQAQKSKPKREAAQSVAKAAPRPAVKVSERNVPDTPAKQDPSTSPQDETAVPITVRKPVAVLPKKRGMAMDVVQAPKPATVAPPSARAPRTAPALQPTHPVVPEAPRPRAASLPAVAASPTAKEPGDDTLASLNLQADGDAPPKTVTEEPAKPAVAASFPDPLDVHGFEAEVPDRHKEKPDSDPPEAMRHATPVIEPQRLGEPGQGRGAQPQNRWQMPTHESHEESEVPAVGSGSVAPPTAELPTTPFVNANVEKRPLGAYAESPAISVPQHPKPDDASEHQPEDKIEPAVEAPATPAELRPEVVAVESADVDYARQQAVADTESPGDLRQMSIPPQYHAEHKDPSKDERPVFDTKDYHPPLQPVPTAKHHTGSKAGLVLTLILIVLLVAAGVGAYFVATGGIDLTRLF